MKRPNTQEIHLDAMMARIRKTVTDKFDLVVGIERGGVLPAYLASRWIDVPMATMKISFRDDNHRPIRETPELISPLPVDASGKRILLCDDVGNTGATLKRAAAEMKKADAVVTLVISGNADISLFGPHDRCIAWPWDEGV